MTFTRREALGLAAGAAVLSGCRKKDSASARAVDSPTARAVGRLGFGLSPALAEEIERTGLQTWVETQLAPPANDAFPLQARIQALPISFLSPWELRDWPQRDVVRQLQQAALIRAVHSPWSVRERLVDFWTNHFAIFARKGMAAYRKPLDERLVVRRHVLGRFPDMLAASAKSAAMLVSLDQQASNARHPNENYARELLELHTLGVDGGYDQQDVMEVARCFTGWTEERGFLRAKGAFKFEPDLHDRGAKTVLGQRIPPGGGIEDGEQVLAILSRHPSTARHIARKLARFFLGDDGRHLESDLAQAYSQSSGDIKAMVRLIADSPWLQQGTPVFKRPFDFVVSALRCLGAETDGGPELQRRLEAMGQPLYQWPMPDGYPMETGAWVSNLLPRWNFAIELATGSIKGTSVENMGSSPDDVFVRAFGRLPQAEDSTLTAELAQSTDPATRLALALSSPLFQWK